jgi:pimeloyl-ACP methyl ester carboxylesterase
LASFSRVILFDKRGTGISDQVPMDDLPAMDSWMENILTVMDAAKSARAVIVGDTEGAAMAILFAATYPERTHSLVLINPIARLFRGPDYPIGMPQYKIDEAAELFVARHGTTGRCSNSRRRRSLVTNDSDSGGSSSSARRCRRARSGSCTDGSSTSMLRLPCRR